MSDLVDMLAVCCLERVRVRQPSLTRPQSIGSTRPITFVVIRETLHTALIAVDQRQAVATVAELALVSAKYRSAHVGIDRSESGRILCDDEVRPSGQNGARRKLKAEALLRVEEPSSEVYLVVLLVEDLNELVLQVQRELARL